ncbi:zf-TFIIB domain-containing protein [Clostridium sp. YIM B02506]|uniref:zf-TFIIB domain-containing protein n=1 Tax=Clostridium sp. YIM B02506 TaxID=2910680 RepID=UPI001EEDDDA3|nr:zf-TFIIB domain-containing protein [Clostridium sp. YIM B02506]
MGKIQFEEAEELPICPHCEKELSTIHRHYKGVLSSVVIYMCPHCRKILNIISED